MTRGIVVAVLALGLAGCSSSDEAVAGDEPITPEAIAAITQEHVDLSPVEVTAWDVFTRELGEPSPGARSEYGDVSLAVVVAPTTDSPLVCATPTFFDECVDDTVDGHDVTIAWQDLEPEEDPGVVYVIDRRDGEDVAVQVIGPDVTDDPRDLDLGVPLEDLAALVTDPRLSLTTSQEVVDLGDQVELSAS
ncbi:hypothetical protein [Nocardioides currus]|uniref:Uncharacterized protein n=1 Tax=Nocardioides currus TaxID=2133958 RepID=A0A2R7YYE4_9ACTN|nr:hypothetical protein [Nocardioides currus]PUA81036.1 hypothetical protein C7S10_11710 [Nocardioides currus]